MYDETLQEFIKDVYKTHLLRHDYINILHEAELDNEEKMLRAIDTSDFELFTAILTGYVRQERFNDRYVLNILEQYIT